MRLIHGADAETDPRCSYLMLPIGERMYPKAYGLTKEQRQSLVSMAIAREYYNEAYLADRFNISIMAVRDICLKMASYIPKKIENRKSIDGHYV